jgi:hypothetical protein
MVRAAWWWFVKFEEAHGENILGEDGKYLGLEYGKHMVSIEL